MHLALELDQSKQVSADPEARPRSRAHRAAEAHRRVRRRRAADPEGGRRPDRGRAGRHHRARAAPRRSCSAARSSSSGSPTRPTRWRRRCPAMDRALRAAGRQRRGHRAGKPSAVEQLLGGDTAKKAAAKREAPARPPARAAAPGHAPRRLGRPRGGGVLAGLIQPAARSAAPSPGEYMVPETGVPAGGQPAQPAGGRPPAPARRRRSAGRRSRPASGSSPTASSTRWRTGRSSPAATSRTPQAQIDPLTNGPIVTFQLDRAGGRKFGDETGRHVGDFMAILLDGRVQGRPPVIQSRIGRNGQITLGGKTPAGGAGPGAHAQGGRAAHPAQDRRGAPGRRQPGQRLDPRRASRPASSAPALVILIMLVYYRLSGVLAVVGARALHPVHARRAVDDRRHAHAAGPRRASCCRSASRWTPTC